MRMFGIRENILYAFSPHFLKIFCFYLQTHKVKQMGHIIIADTYLPILHNVQHASNFTENYNFRYLYFNFIS